MKKIGMILLVLLCSILFTKAQTKKSQKNNELEYIEIAKFKLKEGVTDAQFIEAEKSVREGLINSQKGFISRELSKDTVGFWLMDMRFDNKENMDALFEA